MDVPTDKLPKKEDISDLKTSVSTSSSLLSSEDLVN